MKKEETERYWSEKKKEYERACEFMADMKTGDEYKIERYAIPQNSPYSLDSTAHLTYKEKIKVYAVHKGDQAGWWFTTYDGHAIDAKTVLKWQKLPKQQELGF